MPIRLAFLGFVIAVTARPLHAKEDPIRQVLDAQVVAWNKDDLLGFMSGYWRSPDLVFYSGYTVTRGWQATFDRYQKRYGTGDLGTLTFKDLTIEPLSPKVAFARGSWELKTSDKTQSGLFTLILKKLEGGWKIIHDHSSME